MNRRAILAGIGLTIACSTLKGSADLVEYSPQVVLKVDHAADGKMWVVPQSTVWFRIGPTDANQRTAPLPDGTLMICRLHDLKATNGTFLAARCGFDEFIVQAVGVK